MGFVWGMVFVLLAIPWFFSAWLLAARWDFLLQWLGDARFHTQTVAALACLGVAAFVAALCYWTFHFSGRRGGLCVQRSTEMGNVQISLTVIESLTLRAARRVRGVHNVTAYVFLPVRGDELALCVNLWVTVDGERSLPELTGELQRVVKERIEQIAGVDVARIGVDVVKTAVVERGSMRVDRTG